MQKVLCPKDIAEILHLSPTTVYKLLNQKRIPAVQIQHQYRIPEKEFEEWLLSNVDCKVQIED